MRGIAALLVANTSLLIAVLVYMGWAYDSTFFGYFHVDVLNLGVGVIEYMLVSLSLFSAKLVIAATVLILVSAARTWNLDLRKEGRLAGKQQQPETSPAQDIPIDDPPPAAPPKKASSRRSVLTSFWRVASASSIGQHQTDRTLLRTAGAIVTVTGVALALLASYYSIDTYVVLVLLACGPLLLAWPTRTHHQGRFPYSLAIVVAAVCTLWAGSLYASNLGQEAAQQLIRDLPTRTAVVLYTTQPIALSGPGVTVQRLPSGSVYRYRYKGLRVLTIRSGTYYLLPVGWNPRRDDSTYIVDDSDQVRVELY